MNPPEDDNRWCITSTSQFRIHLHGGSCIIYFDRSMFGCTIAKQLFSKQGSNAAIGHDEPATLLSKIFRLHWRCIEGTNTNCQRQDYMLR